MTLIAKTIEIEDVKYRILYNTITTKNTDIPYLKSLYDDGTRGNILALRRGNEVYIVEEIKDAEWEDLNE
ncbi:hypothetical protein H8D85_02475 [bacterium]|nr:hypothetical protein [bacterium]